MTDTPKHPIAPPEWPIVRTVHFIVSVTIYCENEDQLAERVKLTRPHYEVGGCNEYGCFNITTEDPDKTTLAGIADPAAFVARARAIEEAARWARDEMNGRGRGPGCEQALSNALALPGGAA